MPLVLAPGLAEAAAPQRGGQNGSVEPLVLSPSATKGRTAAQSPMRYGDYKFELDVDLPQDAWDPLSDMRANDPTLGAVEWTRESVLEQRRHFVLQRWLLLVLTLGPAACLMVYDVILFLPWVHSDRDHNWSFERLAGLVAICGVLLLSCLFSGMAYLATRAVASGRAGVARAAAWQKPPTTSKQKYYDEFDGKMHTRYDGPARFAPAQGYALIENAAHVRALAPIP